MARDLMAPDTEPTDEELGSVMDAALVRALGDKEKAAEWLRRAMAEAMRSAFGVEDGSTG